MASLNKDTLILSSVVLAIEKDEDIDSLLAKEAIKTKEIELEEQKAKLNDEQKGAEKVNI